MLVVIVKSFKSGDFIFTEVEFEFIIIEYIVKLIGSGLFGVFIRLDNLLGGLVDWFFFRFGHLFRFGDVFGEFDGLFSLGGFFLFIFLLLDWWFARLLLEVSVIELFDLLSEFLHSFSLLFLLGILFLAECGSQSSRVVEVIHFGDFLVFSESIGGITFFILVSLAIGLLLGASELTSVTAIASMIEDLLGLAGVLKLLLVGIGVDSVGERLLLELLHGGDEECRIHHQLG